MDTFSIKRNDTLPALQAILSDDNGPVDLTGATVLFTMAAASEDDCGNSSSTQPVAKFKKACTVVGSQAVGSPTRGMVRYEWGATDTDTAGYYVGEFEVNYGSSGQIGRAHV